MYFTAVISVDPSKATTIAKVKPTKMFGKLFYHLSGGVFAGKEEQETFAAVSVLQQLNMALREVGVTNIVRLAKDDEDLYFDEHGRDDDLAHAMDAFHQKRKTSEARPFERLWLVLEHDDEELKYIIEVEVVRRHAVGEHPIILEVNAVANDFPVSRASNGKLARQYDRKMETALESVFETQKAYDAFRRKKEAAFASFVDKLETAVEKQFDVDDVIKKIDTVVIRPKKRVRKKKDMAFAASKHVGYHSRPSPIYGGYYGYDDYFFYAYLWSAMSHQHHIHYHNVSVVDDQGQGIFDVGDEGFRAGDNNALNPEAPIENPPGDDVEFHNDHAFAEVEGFSGGVPASEVSSGTTETERSVGGSEAAGGGLLAWFSSDGGGSSCGGSSCSSGDGGGSSCGSSCGGGGCGGCGGG